MTETIGEWREDDLIAQIIAPHATALDDDTALLQPPFGHELLVSSDALLEDVHFLRSARPEDVGFKAAAVNLSDIAASGGDPRWLTLTLGLPRDLPADWLRGFMTGFAEALQPAKATLVGGDLTRAEDRIAISVTAIGSVPTGKRVSRSGAQPGDWLAVTGYIGDAALGLDFILGKRDPSPHPEAAQKLMERHYRPTYRGDLAAALVESGLVTAMMDLSDGLAVDLPRLCKASNVGVELDLSKIPISPEAKRFGLTPEDAIASGEDYELLVCGSKPFEALEQDSQRNINLIPIGNLRNQGPNSALKIQSKWGHFRN